MCEQIIRHLAGVFQMPQLGHQHQVLPAGQDLIHCGELSGQADGFPHLERIRRDIKSFTVAVPASGLSSVDRILTMVVFPAPLEPRRAKMLPGATSKSTPRSTCRSL